MSPVGEGLSSEKTRRGDVLVLKIFIRKCFERYIGSKRCAYGTQFTM